MTNQPLTHRSASLGALLRQPYEQMSTWLYAELARRGHDDVRPAYSAVLRNLPMAGARVGELAQRAGMAKQSMGYLVEQMAGAGLVEVVPDAQDRRANTVRLTVRGNEVVAMALMLSREYEAHFGALLGERKMAQLRGLLEELALKLEPGAEHPPGTTLP
jgi:DNA-binding MarR family transcriptional regulator